MDFRGSVGFIGGGNMAEALVAGMVNKGSMAPGRILVAEPREERRARLALHYGIAVTSDNLEAASGAGTLFLAVKPQVLPSVLPALAPALPAGGLVVSIAAGFPLRKLASALPGTSLVRAMPNTPALIGCGATVLSPGPLATPAMTDWAREIFASVGVCLVMPEERMDAVTGLSGSGPAYVFLLAEAMTEGGVRMGLSRTEASLLARQTVFGAGRMMIESGPGPAELRESVTSPGGTTVEGLRVLEEAGFPGMVARAVEAAALKSRKLGEG
jgi:pyrroline-5-carboxylate reductase